VATTLEKIDVWSHILQFVEHRLNKHIYDSWFRPIQFKGHDESERIVYLAAGQVTKEWVTIYYSDLLKQAAEGTEFAGYRFDWKIEDSETAEERFSEMPSPELFETAEKSFAAKAGGDNTPSPAAPAHRAPD